MAGALSTAQSRFRLLARSLPSPRPVMRKLEKLRVHIATSAARTRYLEERIAGFEAMHTPVLTDLGERRVEAVHMIDHSWCDGGGVFLQGWVHAGPHPVRRVIMQCGPDRAETTAFRPRPDVADHYPDLPPGGAAQFSLYLACRACLPLVLGVVTDAGSYETAVLPATVEDVNIPDATAAMEAFAGAMRERGGTVMELGARVVGTMTQGWRARFEPACTFLGSDIHPGPGIDVVGDAHALTRHVEPGSLDGLFSIAVLEHLAAPWVAAGEINRALKMGGETVHVTHQTWPVHETPNDFFRFSDQALRSLFGPATGFKVVECGMAHPVSVMPPPHLRHADWLMMPFGVGYGQSFIRARKVAEAEGAASGWGAGEMERVSREYPRRGE